MPESTEHNFASKTALFFKELFTRRDPYVLATMPANIAEIEENSPLKYNIENYKKNADSIVEFLNNKLKQEKNQLRVTKEQFDKAPQYLVPEIELKPGDSFAVRGGNVTYEDLQEVAENTKNADKSFSGKLPKIFIMPYLPVLDFGTQYIAKELLVDSEAIGVSYDRKHDAILLNPNSRLGQNPDELKAFVGHEVGHKAINDIIGIIKTDGNITSHLIPESELERIKSCALHYQEYKADTIATLSNPRYGQGISASKDLDPTKNYSHPSSLDRIENIKEINANPELSRHKLAEEFAKFRANASNPTNVDSLAPIPVPANTELAKQCKVTTPFRDH